MCVCVCVCVCVRAERNFTTVKLKVEKNVKTSLNLNNVNHIAQTQQKYMPKMTGFGEKYEKKRRSEKNVPRE